MGGIHRRRDRSVAVEKLSCVWRGVGGVGNAFRYVNSLRRIVLLWWGSHHSGFARVILMSSRLPGFQMVTLRGSWNFAKKIVNSQYIISPKPGFQRKKNSYRVSIVLVSRPGGTDSEPQVWCYCVRIIF